MCEKTWPEYNKGKIIIHYLDDHQANLGFLPDDQISLMIKEIPEENTFVSPPHPPIGGRDGT